MLCWYTSKGQNYSKIKLQPAEPWGCMQLPWGKGQRKFSEKRGGVRGIRF